MESADGFFRVNNTQAFKMGFTLASKILNIIYHLLCTT